MIRDTPEGYEPAEHSAAKNVAHDSIEKALEDQGLDPYPDDDSGPDLTNLADAVVEGLIKAGVVIPENIADPHQIAA